MRRWERLWWRRAKGPLVSGTKRDSEFPVWGSQFLCTQTRSTINTNLSAVNFLKDTTLFHPADTQKTEAKFVITPLDQMRNVQTQWHWAAAHQDSYMLLSHEVFSHPQSIRFMAGANSLSSLQKTPRFPRMCISQRTFCETRLSLCLDLSQMMSLKHKRMRSNNSCQRMFYLLRVKQESSTTWTSSVFVLMHKVHCQVQKCNCHCTERELNDYRNYSVQK